MLALSPDSSTLQSRDLRHPALLHLNLTCSKLRTCSGISGTPPVESGPDTYTYWYESAVWDMEMQQDGRLHIIPYWINPDRYKAQLSFAAVPQLGILTATGDFNEFIKYYPDVKGFPYVQVFLELA